MNTEPPDWSLVELASNLSYLEELEARFRKDPQSLDPKLVELLKTGALPTATAKPGPSRARPAASAAAPVSGGARIARANHPGHDCDVRQRSGRSQSRPERPWAATAEACHGSNSCRRALRAGHKPRV